MHPFENVSGNKRWPSPAMTPAKKVVARWIDLFVVDPFDDPVPAAKNHHCDYH
jgi:hypothetical protein